MKFEVRPGEQILLDTCPANIIERNHFELVGLYSHYKAGLFLDEGGVRNQLAYYLSAMLIIGSEVSRIEERMMEKSKRKGRR